MKIVDRKTFRLMPEGTVFMKFEPCVFGELEILGGACGTDDYVTTPIGPHFVNGGSTASFMMACDNMESGRSEALEFDGSMRDGLFDSNQLYAVFEKADVEGLIGWLQTALQSGYSA